MKFLQEVKVFCELTETDGVALNRFLYLMKDHWNLGRKCFHCFHTKKDIRHNQNI